jgi:hypothetical protein
VFKAILIFLFLFPQVANANTRDGLIGWWRFDEGSGTVANDSSKAGHPGTLTNSPSYVAGVRGPYSLLFNGNNTVVSTTSDFIGTSAITIAVWINPKSYGGGLPFIIDNGKTRLFMNSGDTSYRFRSDGSTTAQISAQALNTLTHLAITRDASGNAQYYVNGVASGSSQSSGAPVAGSTNVGIGNVIAANNGFDGTLDDVRIYNRVLTTQEIKDLYSVGINLNR